MTSTETITRTAADVEVDTLTTKARTASLSHLGTKAEREGNALAALLNWWDEEWVANTAVELHARYRDDDRDMWSHAATVLNSTPRDTRDEA